LLILESVSLFVGPGKLLLDEANLVINPGDRIGIIGRNGSGKTQLMRILSGETEPDAGKRRIVDNVSVLLVQQQLPEGNETPLEFLRNNDPDLKKLEEAMDACKEEAFADFSDQCSNLETERYEKLAPQVLIGLGLTRAQLSQPMRQLSGGLRMRVGMAIALVRQPNVLLLDEPTNHLDLESAQWLISYLMSYPRSAAIVIVTHDIALLEQVTTTTMHLRGGELRRFEGTYQRYRQHLDTEDQKDARRNESLTRRIEQKEDIYYRFRNLPENRAAQAVAQHKQAEKLKTQLVELVVEEPVIPLTFAQPTKLQDPILKLTQVSAGYGPTIILNDLNLSIQYGEKIGLLGRNGQGKSTFIRMLANRMEPLDGTIERTQRLEIGYFSQELTEQLDVNKTVAQQFIDSTKINTETLVRAHLDRYGFPHNKLQTLVGELSGGERSRLLFCIICVRAPQLIILDEPLNHLDVETREKLIEAIKTFPGSILLVSHDWDLHEQAMQKFWLADRGTVRPFPYSLSNYKQELQHFIAQNMGRSAGVVQEEHPKTSPASPHTPKLMAGSPLILFQPAVKSSFAAATAAKAARK
jgi:ATP-binding cassette, subfamily F, member 3